VSGARNSAAKTGAVVREGTDVMGGIWAEERYDWTEPGIVRATVRDSNAFVAGGTWEMRVRPDNGGSNVELIWHREGKGIKGRVVVTAMRLSAGGRE
jgi:hypothetical protein